MKERLVPNFVTSFCDWSNVYEGCYIFRFWSAIAIISAALERKTWYNLGDSQIFPNLYVFLIGGPATRKTFTSKLAMRFLKSVDGIHFTQDRLTPAALLKTLKDSERVFMYNNKAVTHSSVFAYSSELRTILEDIGGGSPVGLMTDFFDSRSHGEVFESRTVKHNKERITGPGLSFLGCSTPDWFINTLPASTIEGGFTSRVVFVVHTGRLDRTIPEPEVPNKLLEGKLVDTIRRIHSIIGPYEFTTEARLEYNTWYHDFMSKVELYVPDERLAGYAGRKGDLVRKVAMCLAAAQRDELIINEFDVVMAIEALNTLEPNMMKAFGQMGENDNSRTIARMFRTIPEHPNEITHSDLLQLNWRHVGDTKGFLGHIDMLSGMGAIRKRITEDRQKIYYTREPNFDLSKAKKKLNAMEKEQMKKLSEEMTQKEPNGNGNEITHLEKEEPKDVQSPIPLHDENRPPKRRSYFGGHNS